MSIIDSEEQPLFKTASRAYVIGKLQEEEGYRNTDQQHQELPARIRRYLIATKLQDNLEFINAVLSLILTLIYAVSTYWENSMIPNIVYFEMPILLYMISDFLLFFYISLNRLQYLISIQSFITYVTVIPELLILTGAITEIETINTYELTFWKVFRIFSISRLQIVFVRRNMSLTSVYFQLLYTIGAIILLFASLMLMIENRFYIKPTLISVTQKLAQDPDAELTSLEQNARAGTFVFHDVLYYVIVTFTTCGYGDITPKTVQGQMLFVLMMVYAMYSIAMQFTQMQKIKNLHSKFSTISYKPKLGFKHVLLCGDFSHEFFQRFLKEFYNPDHGKIKYHIVILRNSEPTAEMKEIMSKSIYSEYIQYIKGDSIVSYDLERCRVDQAVSCLIVGERSLKKSAQKQDYRNILTAFAIKKYSSMIKSQENQLKKKAGGNVSGMPVYLQLMSQEHKQLYFYNSKDAKKLDQVVCIEELKLKLLAKSATTPGIINIIWGLITSDSEPGDEHKEFEIDFIEYINKKKNITNSNAFLVIESQQLVAENKKDIEMEALYQKNLVKFNKWQMNYLSGSQYEIYRVPLLRQKFYGLKFKDVVMIIYHKMHITLIAIEIKFASRVKVFVNPSEYVFQDCDHWAYVIHHEKPDFNDLNTINLDQESSENYFLLHYIKRVEQTITKKEMIQQQKALDQMMEDYDNSLLEINFENYFTTKKPMNIRQAMLSELPNSIEGHILVCGIVKGIINLILPLRLKTLGTQKRPIVILFDGNMGNDSESGDTQLWNEINRFEDIFIIKGSAFNPADLEKARVSKAKAIIILAKYQKHSKNQIGPQVLDADQIFMYKTIEANYKNVSIVTELAQMSALDFIVNETPKQGLIQNYYTRKPFAAGEIFVGSILNCLMIQSFYSPLLIELLDQFILGSANTNAEIYRMFKKMNLDMCSLNLIEIPANCEDLIYESVFEFCVRRNQVPIGIYRRDIDDYQQSTDKESYGKSKPYVWTNPPKNIQLTIHDELFVLCEKNPKGETTTKNEQNFGISQAKKYVDKTQENSMLKLNKLESQLQDLVQTAKDLGTEMMNSSEFVAKHFDLKLRYEMEANEDL